VFVCLVLAGHASAEVQTGHRSVPVARPDCYLFVIAYLLRHFYLFVIQAQDCGETRGGRASVRRTVPCAHATQSGFNCLVLLNMQINTP
jgi:hypothetical protein